MTNEELKKKIESIIRNAKRDFAYCVPEEWAVKVLADALIAAGIGDIREAEHRAKVAERALEILNDYECISNPIRYYMKQAEKELSEEKENE